MSYCHSNMITSSKTHRFRIKGKGVLVTEKKTQTYKDVDVF